MSPPCMPHNAPRWYVSAEPIPADEKERIMLELGIDKTRFEAQEDAIQCRIEIECEFYRQHGCFSKDHKKSMIERAAYDKYSPHAAPMQPSCTAHESLMQPRMQPPMHWPCSPHSLPMQPPCSPHLRYSPACAVICSVSHGSLYDPTEEELAGAKEALQAGAISSSSTGLDSPPCLQLPLLM